MIKSVLMFAAALSIAKVASAESVPLQPTAKWVVDFADAQCVASRNYGTKDKPLFLTVKEPAHRSVIQLGLVRKGPSTEPQQVVAKLQFDDGPEIKTSMVSFFSESAHLRVYQINVPIDQFNAGINAGTLRIDGKWLDERFALSDLPALMRTMDRCVADLRQHWNVVDAPPGQSKDDKAPPNPHLREPSKGDLAGYFSSDDYPGVAIAKSQGGAVKFSLLIDEQGRVADCSVIETSGIASLDAQSCAILIKRARFTPAIGLDGKPARDSMIGRVRWVIP